MLALGVEKGARPKGLPRRGSGSLQAFKAPLPFQTHGRKRLSGCSHWRFSRVLQPEQPPASLSVGGSAGG